jgi:uncharacterized metal-binding protein
MKKACKKINCFVYILTDFGIGSLVIIIYIGHYFLPIAYVILTQPLVPVVLSFIVSEKKKKRWTMHWRFGLKIREQFTISAFSHIFSDCMTNLITHIDKCLLK